MFLRQLGSPTGLAFAKGLFALALPLFATACGFDEHQNSNLSGIIRQVQKWSHPSDIRVCWANSTGPGVTSIIMNDIQNIVSREYNRTAALRFTGWAACENQSDKDLVRVFLDSNDSAGRSYIGRTSDLRLTNYGYPTATMYIGIKNYNSGSKKYVLSAALHEFGHAAGLAHEHQRVDSTCPLAQDQEDIPNGGGSDFIYAGGFDSESIMSYCNRDSLTLSTGDVDSINILYPSPHQPNGGISGNVTFKNLGGSPFKNHYLDIDGNNGRIILSSVTGSGIQWKAQRIDGDKYTLQNLGNSPYRNYYLDIDGNTGAVILSKNKHSGILWRIVKTGSGYIMQNVGSSRFRNYYLDIDGNTGAVVLSPTESSGTHWN
jgi:hypothetical protein